MRELLEAVAAGETSVAAAEAELAGYATGDAGRFDAAREDRSGVPEAVLAADKTPGEVADLAAMAVETTGRALVTRADADDAAAVTERLAGDHPDAAVERTAVGRETDEHTDTFGVLVARTPDFEPPALDADVAVVTAGTADAGPAGEAAAVAREMGARVEIVEDVGVAGLARLVDRLPDLREADVLVVAAGREGALPTVVAGLVDTPVVGLPVSVGYGHGGDGEAALAGMLQSCTALTVVNVDNGFAAGAQAGLIARALDGARGEGGR